MRKKYLLVGVILLPLLLVAAAVFGGTIDWHADYRKLAEGNILSQTRVIDVQNDVNSYSPEIHCGIERKLQEADDLLAPIELTVGKRELVWYEERFTYDSNGVSVRKKKMSDPERQIGLVLMNTNTCALKTVVITHRAGKLIVPDGYQIDFEQRPSGIQWNWWNTAYTVKGPYIVLKNKYPYFDYEGSGKNRRKVVKYFVYAPYSSGLHTPLLVNAGLDTIKKVVTDAYNELRKRNVYSRAVPGTLVADLPALNPRYFEILPIIEQTDLAELLTDPIKTSERVLVIFGSNPNSAYAKTKSSADAVGALQFTPGTYEMIRNKYPNANLIPDFEEGATDHTNVMMAAILLYDDNLAGLIDNFGKDIIHDPRLEEYLAAAYNGNPKWVTDSLQAALTRHLPDWIDKLRSETQGYIPKIRILRTLDLFAK